MDLRRLSVETDRLLLRPFRESDFAALVDMHARPAVVRYLPWAARDEAATRRVLQRHLDPRFEVEGDALTLAGTEKESGAFVGEFVLFLRSVEHRSGEVGYILHPDAFGRGYATEGARAMLRIGFDQLKLHRIIGRIDSRNTASAAVLGKLGMRREAHFVRNEHIKGEWTDEVVFALLEEEWAGLPHAK